MKNNLMSRIMAEHIMLGGEIMTRAEAYKAIIKDGLGHECADYFAFHGPALEDVQQVGQ